MNNRSSKVLLAAAVVVMVSLACSMLGGALLEDDFEGNNTEWGTGTDADSSVEYDSGGLRMKVFTPNFFVWSTPNADAFENVHIEVTVKNNGTDPLTAFAIICDVQDVTNSFYFLAVTPDGQYAIADKSLALDNIYLTADGGWGESDKIKQNADSYRLGADCGNGVLTLYVDGQQIDSVSDSTYTRGFVGLMLWSDEEVGSVDVTFDDFIVTNLEE